MDRFSSLRNLLYPDLSLTHVPFSLSTVLPERNTNTLMRHCVERGGDSDH